MGPGLGAACLEPHLPGLCRFVPTTGWLLICITLKLHCCAQLGKNIVAALLFGFSHNTQHARSLTSIVHCFCCCSLCILSPTSLISTCCLQGAVATLHGSKLVCLNSAAGSPKLDLAMSLDIQATAVSMHSISKTQCQWQLSVVQISRIDRNVNKRAFSSFSPLLTCL